MQMMPQYEKMQKKRRCHGSNDGVEKLSVSLIVSNAFCIVSLKLGIVSNAHFHLHDIGRKEKQIFVVFQNVVDRLLLRKVCVLLIPITSS